MATKVWVGNAQAVAQVMTFTVTNAANTRVFTIYIPSSSLPNKSVSFTATASDNNATAAALQALLAASTDPEFTEITWTVLTNVITATAKTAGLPFTAAAAATGGGTLTAATPTANQSPNDVNNANNWSPQGVPTGGEQLLIADTSVSILYGLSTDLGLSASYTQLMSFTGDIGLPAENPAGYLEYRTTYWNLKATTSEIGRGDGNGSSMTKIQLGSSSGTMTVLNTSTPSDGLAALRVLSSTNFALNIQSGSVAVAMLAGEGSSLASVQVFGGSLDIGSGCTIASSSTIMNKTGAMKISADLGNVTTLTVDGGSLTVDRQTAGATVPALTIRNGGSVTWVPAAIITALTMTAQSNFTKQGSGALTVTSATLDTDCQVSDVDNKITFTNAPSIVGPINGPIFVTGTGRTLWPQ